MSGEAITYCGVWSENGPAQKLVLHHVTNSEIDQLTERARVTALASGIKLDNSAGIDEAIAKQLFAILPELEADRERKAQAAAEVAAKRAHLRLCDGTDLVE